MNAQALISVISCNLVHCVCVCVCSYSDEEIAKLTAADLRPRARYRMQWDQVRTCTPHIRLYMYTGNHETQTKVYQSTLRYTYFRAQLPVTLKLYLKWNFSTAYLTICWGLDRMLNMPLPVANFFSNRMCSDKELTNQTATFGP